MRFENVCLEAFGHALPEERVTSLELEERLAPVYERMGLSTGRIEMLSGIRERRFWPPGTRPSTVAARAGEVALEKSGVDRASIGCLVHASVSRDFMEPATATIVHHHLGLAPTCQVFDVSNACLGFANALTTVGSMIERGEIEAGLVVTGEDSRPLVDETIRFLNSGPGVGRAEVKRAYASLTIGSGAAAAVLTRADVSRTKSRLVGGTVLADTAHHELCSGGPSENGSGPLMNTDSEAILHAGNALAIRTWERFAAHLGWNSENVDRFVTHQVTVPHKRLLFESLALDPARDFPTVEHLGNTGSAALPISFSMAVEEGFIQKGHRVAMLGIGSGLHCLMLGVEW